MVSRKGRSHCRRVVQVLRFMSRVTSLGMMKHTRPCVGAPRCRMFQGKLWEVVILLFPLPCNLSGNDSVMQRPMLLHPFQIILQCEALQLRAIYHWFSIPNIVQYFEDANEVLRLISKCQAVSIPWKCEYFYGLEHCHTL